MLAVAAHFSDSLNPRRTARAGLVLALGLAAGVGPAFADADPGPWHPPRPTARGERVAERNRMVATQFDDVGRDVVSIGAAVREAMRAVPRHVFVPGSLQKNAYDDTPLPIGHGQTISQPYIVAAMTELLGVTPQTKVLEIGTGSGYQTAVLAQLTPHVYSVEILEPLATRAERTLRAQGYDAPQLRQGDGYFGWPEAAPFDAILVTCAAGHLPAPLWEQLAPGGRVVIPIGGVFSVQRLVVIEKDEQGGRHSRTIMSVSFVPMTGRVRGD
jgi:protein-L-isoaspartate(D-aspartate) O-methyltransferase